MKTTRKYSKLLSGLLSLVVLLGGCLGWGEGVGAETTTQAKVTITSGSLTFTDAPDNLNFSPTTLSGAEQNSLADLTTLTITDARGTGAGWSVEVYASQFTNTTDSLLKLDWDSLSILKPTLFTPNAIGSNPPQSNLGDTARVIDKEVATPAVIINAPLNAGLGVWTIGWDPGALKLKLNPATTRVGTYSSIITWQLDIVPDPS